MHEIKDKRRHCYGCCKWYWAFYCHCLYAAGAMVALSDIDEAKLVQEVKHLAVKGAKTLAMKTDVGNTEDVKHLIHQTINTVVRVDILVNNAAVAIAGNIIEMPERDWDNIMNNFKVCIELLKKRFRI